MRMSSALVQKALEIVDPEFGKNSKRQKLKKSKNVFNLMPEKDKITKVISKKGRKERISLVSTSKKLTVTEVKKNLKSKETILKENLKKLKEIRKACTIELDKEVTEQIIERAVTKRPIKPKRKPKKIQKTAFTEEDFKKFEEEYQG